MGPNADFIDENSEPWVMPLAVPSGSPQGTGKAGLLVLPSACSSPSLSSSGNRLPVHLIAQTQSWESSWCQPCPVSHQICLHPVHAALCPGADLEGPHQWAPSEFGSQPTGSGQEITGEWREVERAVNSFPGPLPTGKARVQPGLTLL